MTSDECDSTVLQVGGSEMMIVGGLGCGLGCKLSHLVNSGEVISSEVNYAAHAHLRRHAGTVLGIKGR